jgi:hypothetical protein
MSAHDKQAPAEPNRSEVEDRLQRLVDGRLSRDEVAAWAKQWVLADDPRISDPTVWRVLQSMSGADLISTDRPFLYDTEDFEAWLTELNASGR